MTSGAIPTRIAGKDCIPSKSCSSSGQSIFSQVPTWRVYAESMPTNCDRTNTSNGLYVPRHTAAPYYTDLTNCSTNQIPLGSTSSGSLASDLSSGNLASFSMIIPNTTDDAHSGCLSCADKWLSAWMPKIVASPAYQNGSTAVFITYDSDSKNSGNHVATMVVAPSVDPGTTSASPFNHYSLLRTVEDLLGVTVHLGGAANAPSMVSPFNL